MEKKRERKRENMKRKEEKRRRAVASLFGFRAKRKLRKASQ
jgi:hypothetical protein